MNEGRLPRPRPGAPSPRVRLALRLYRRLWVNRKPGLPPLKVTVYRGALNAALGSMTRQETADYYAALRKMEGE